MNFIHSKYISIIILFISIFIHSAVIAQENQAANDADAIAKELANPNTTLGTLAFPIDFINYGGTLPEAGKQNSFLLSLQPSLPIPLSQGINLFVRPLIPVFLSQPFWGVNGFEQRGINLGNISADVAVGKTWPSKTITILGVFAGFPTATDSDLRTSEVTFGPELMIAQLFDWGAVGVMINHAWGLGSDSDIANPDQLFILENVPRHASVTAGQYFYTINLPDAWQITGQPTWSYNHNADEGNRFTFPIGIGVNKVTNFGKIPVKLTLQYWYYVASQDAFGPQHQVRFQIAPVLPLPW